MEPNVGEVALNASKLIGNEGQVIAFEPDPINFERLARNMELNRGHRINAVHKGLGKLEGNAFIQVIDKGNLGRNTIVQRREEGAVEIRLTTLDKYIE